MTDKAPYANNRVNRVRNNNRPSLASSCSIGPVTTAGSLLAQPRTTDTIYDPGELSIRRNRDSQARANRTTRAAITQKLPILCAELALALGEQGIVNDELPLKDLVITEVKGAEAMRNPAKALAGRMRIRRPGISCTNNLGEK